MFRVNLRSLDRERTRRVQGEIPPDDPLWEGMEPQLAGPVSVTLDLQATPGGQVVGRGALRAALLHECRRCLRPTERELEMRLDLVWVHPDELQGVEDGEIRVLDPGSLELDPREALREELLLAAPRFVVCWDDCRGLCPRCGINRNEETCDCTQAEPDPRWEALRALKSE